MNTLPEWETIPQSFGIPMRYPAPIGGPHVALSLGLHTDKHGDSKATIQKRLDAQDHWYDRYEKTLFPVICFCAHSWNEGCQGLKAHAAHTHCLRCVQVLPFGATLCFTCYDMLNKYDNRKRYISAILISESNAAHRSASQKTSYPAMDKGEMEKYHKAQAAYDEFQKTGLLVGRWFWPEADSVLPWDVPYIHH